MPPSVASAPGSTGKKSPAPSIAAFNCLRVTPASTVAVRSSPFTAMTLFIRDRSTVTPPSTAMMCPSIEVPAP